MPVSEDRLDGLQVQCSTAAVNEGLKHLVHVPAHLEDQVSTVFDLIVGVLVTEPAALLLVEVEREAYTVVNPTLADLAQSPYSPGLGQGVCDLGQTCGVRDRSVRWAAHESGGLKSLRRSDEGRCIQRRG